MRPTFEEAPLSDLRRALERLILTGRITAVPATVEARAAARIPDSAGPVYRELATAYESLTLAEAEIVFHLHRGELAGDERGGWRIDADPEQLDVRLLPRSPANPEGDLVVDCTFSEDAVEEDVIHSTFLHFIVRGAVGSRLDG